MQTIEKQPALLASEANRKRLVTNMLSLTQDTHLAPTTYEITLLDQFVRGSLSIERVVSLLEMQAGPQEP